MFSIKELAAIITVIILFAFIISFLQGLEVFLSALITATIIIAVNVISKKLIAYRLDSKIEQKIWQWQRWGFYERSKLKKPIPAGIIFPFILIWISYPLGFLKMLTFLQFDVSPLPSRAAKKHSLYRYTEMTEWHIASIAGFGIFCVLVLAAVAYLLNYPDLARYSIYFSLWNLLPIGQLDGCKILFGSRLLWYILSIFVLIGLFYSLFLV